MQPPGPGGCSRSTALLAPVQTLGLSKPLPLVLGQMCPPNPHQNASSSLEVLIHLKSQASRAILLPTKGMKQGICELVSDGKQTLAKHPGPSGELIACSFQTQHLISVLPFCLCSNCCEQEKKKNPSHFTPNKILPGKGFSAVFCFANVINECVNTCWHRFPTLLRLEFRLLTCLPARSAPFVNPVHPLIRGSLAGQRCAQALLLGWLLYYYCNCKCHMWEGWRVCLEGWLCN